MNLLVEVRKVGDPLCPVPYLKLLLKGQHRQQELEEEEFRLHQKRKKQRLKMERSKIDAEESILAEAEIGLMSASNSQLVGAAAAKPKIDFPRGGTATAEVDTCHPLGGVSSQHKIADVVISPLGGATVVLTRN